ncbi:MAG: CxxC-x17-CxxC domain-containing protein [Bradymonadales bacterium]|jgi:CxxC-x17-CxxC domain-containing protein
MGEFDKFKGQEARIRVEAVCDECSAKIVVPFKPIEGRAVLCRDCLSNHRAHRRQEQGDSLDGRYEIKCTHCGQLDSVPFKPYEHSVVLCSDCLANPNIIRVGGKILHSIICSNCGRESRVPFKPDTGSRVLCKSCHVDEREQKNKARERFANKHPSDVHGTKVRIEIQCERCGVNDILNYIPKTTGAILCKSCAEATFGEEWAARHKLQTKEFPFTCCRCSNQDFVPFRPKAEHDLLCKRCLNEQAILRGDKDELEPINPHIYLRRNS